MKREVRTLAEINRKTQYADMTEEELERRLRETFYCPDRIDEAVCRELEELLEVLEEKQPSPAEPDPEEDWQCFLTDRAEELAELFPSEAAVSRPGKGRTVPALLRRALIAAVIVVLLAGAALAADSLGLIAWVPKWNAVAGRYEPVAMETDGKPIPAALAELGITEPVYPAHLPEGFVITESHISEDPLVLMEQYARGNQTLSITITPIKGFQNAVYPGGGETYRVYGAGSAIHYLFRNEGAITAVWYTEHYATSVSGNLTLEEAARIIDSMYGSSEGGYFS